MTRLCVSCGKPARTEKRDGRRDLLWACKKCHKLNHWYCSGTSDDRGLCDECWTPAEHGLLMSDCMVRAMLSGVKTETRRTSDRPWALAKPGDGLWVKEVFRRTLLDYGNGWVQAATYRADRTHRAVPGIGPVESRDGRGCWRSSLLMPRSACRLERTLTAIRQEPIQEIDEAGAVREGMMTVTVDDLVELAKGSKWRVLRVIGAIGQESGFRNVPLIAPDSVEGEMAAFRPFWSWVSARDRFRVVFELLNGPEKWEQNGPVWVLKMGER